MCDPTTIMLASAGMQAGSGIIAGRAAKDAGDLNADRALEASGFEARRIRRAGEAQRGETVAALAASGVKVGEGSALDAERRVMEDAAVDEQIALLTGRREARAYRVEGRQRRNAANIGVVTSLLSSGGNYMKASGWGARGPGFSGQQMPAPVTDRSIRG